MTENAHSQISERVVQTAERLENTDDPEEIDPLEVKVTASLDGTAREVVAVLTTGAPHIEVNLTRGVVSGSWGGESHRTHCDAGVLDVLEDRFLRQWEAADPQR